MKSWDSIINKVEQKLASHGAAELLGQKIDAEISDLAFTCYKKANVGQSILDSIKSFGENVVSTPGGMTAATSIGGGLLGGIAGASMPVQGEFESDEDFKKRKFNTALTTGVAGGAMGAAVPSIMSAVKGINDGLSTEKTIKDRLRDAIINPTTIVGGTGAAGGLAVGSYFDKMTSETNKNLVSQAQGLKEMGKVTEADNILKKVYGSPKAAPSTPPNPLLAKLMGAVDSVEKKFPKATGVAKSVGGAVARGASNKNVIRGAGGASAALIIAELLGNRRVFNEPTF